jgi:hypothetical protein
MKQKNEVPVQKNVLPHGDGGVQREKYESPTVRIIELAAYEILGSCINSQNVTCQG